MKNLMGDIDRDEGGNNKVVARRGSIFVSQRMICRGF